MIDLDRAGCSRTVPTANECETMEGFDEHNTAATAEERELARRWLEGGYGRLYCALGDAADAAHEIGGIVAHLMVPTLHAWQDAVRAAAYKGKPEAE